MAETLQPLVQTLTVCVEQTQVKEAPVQAEQNKKVQEAAKPAWEYLSTAGSYARKTLNGARIVANAAYTTAKWTLIAATVYGIYQAVGIPSFSDARETFNGFVYMAKSAVDLGRGAGETATIFTDTMGGVGQAVDYARQAVNAAAGTEYAVATTRGEQVGLGLMTLTTLNVVGFVANAGSALFSNMGKLLAKSTGESVWNVARLGIVTGTVAEVVAPGALQATAATLSEGKQEVIELFQRTPGNIRFFMNKVMTQIGTFFENSGKVDVDQLAEAKRHLQNAQRLQNTVYTGPIPTYR